MLLRCKRRKQFECAACRCTTTRMHATLTMQVADAGLGSVGLCTAQACRRRAPAARVDREGDAWRVRKGCCAIQRHLIVCAPERHQVRERDAALAIAAPPRVSMQESGVGVKLLRRRKRDGASKPRASPTATASRSCPKAGYQSLSSRGGAANAGCSSFRSHSPLPQPTASARLTPSRRRGVSRQPSATDATRRASSLRCWWVRWKGRWKSRQR